MICILGITNNIYHFFLFMCRDHGSLTFFKVFINILLIFFYFLGFFSFLFFFFSFAFEIKNNLKKNEKSEI
jgi:hypothetical protein